MSYVVYIATNKRKTVFYVGVTNNLERRSLEHAWKKDGRSFTARYNIDTIVWFEAFQDVRDAIENEKRIKKWKREKKLDLVRGINPEFRDLSK